MDEIFRRQRVGDVEGEIADTPAISEKFQVIIIADEVAVGVAGPDLFENPLLAGFEDARWSEPNR